MIDKNLRRLHKIYKKHDPKQVASVKWGNNEEALYRCTCGQFFFKLHEADVKFYDFDSDTLMCWIVACAEGLKGPLLEEFRAYIRTKRKRSHGPHEHLAIFGRKPRPKERE